MDGSSVDFIVIPIVAVISLAAWLVMVYWADRDPLKIQRTAIVTSKQDSVESVQLGVDELIEGHRALSLLTRRPRVVHSYRCHEREWLLSSEGQKDNGRALVADEAACCCGAG
jgi:hypothetical protein